MDGKELLRDGVADWIDVGSDSNVIASHISGALSSSSFVTAANISPWIPYRGNNHRDVAACANDKVIATTRDNKLIMYNKNETDGVTMNNANANNLLAIKCGSSEAEIFGINNSNQLVTGI